MIKGVFIDYRGELLRSSLTEMERDFGRRVLTTLFLCLQQYLVKDLVKMIGKLVQRDYKMDPVWKFLTNPNKMVDYKICLRGAFKDRYSFVVCDPCKYYKFYGHDIYNVHSFRASAEGEEIQCIFLSPGEYAPMWTSICLE